MDAEKQIEEMAKEIGNFDCFDCDNCKCVVIKSENIDCIDYALAEHLIVFKGYRRASDVAGKIIGEILFYMDTHKEFDGADFGRFLAELEKKYTEEGK